MVMVLNAVGAPAMRFWGGDAVVVLYNSNLPESKAVADYYAARRAVPRSQVWGFDAPTNEEISRVEFKDSIQEPFLEKLEKSKLWRFGAGTMTRTNGEPMIVQGKLVESAIRYAVL